MRVVHVCLACPYIEGLEYQENILPRCHARMGLETYVITSIFPNKKWGSNKYSGLVDYTNDDMVHVKILKRKVLKFGKKALNLGLFSGVFTTLQNIAPDIIFVHGLQFISLNSVIKYVKKNHEVRLFVDHHTDFYNTKIKKKTDNLWISLWKQQAKGISKYVTMFWGTTPWRVTYLRNVYDLPEEKVRYLEMGADDELIHFDERQEIRRSVRELYKIEADDFLIVSGGKVDMAKNIHLVAEAVDRIDDSHVKLLIFGTIADDVNRYIEKIKSDKIITIGWIDSQQIYNLFLSADLALFPGTHSVMWEQAVACKIPCIFKDWGEDMHQFDIGGNCLFIKDVISDSIRVSIQQMIDDYGLFHKAANSNESEKFMFSHISKKAIEFDD